MKSPYNNPLYKNGTQWSDIDQDALVAMYRNDMDLDDIAAQLNRTVASCIKKLQLLREYRGMKNKPKDLIRKMLDWRRMTDDDQKYVNSILLKPSFSQEDTLNLMRLGSKWCKPDMRVDLYKKVGKVR